MKAVALDVITNDFGFTKNDFYN